MPTQLNPCQPCCKDTNMIILAGAYCSFQNCDAPQNSDGTVPSIIKFYAQTITLWYGDELIDSATIASDIELARPLGVGTNLPEGKYLSKKWIDEEGNLKITEIEADRGGSLGGWPPTFLYSDTVVPFGKYKLVYDLGKYGKHEIEFTTQDGDYINYLYISLSSFLTDTGYGCCGKCLISRADLTVDVEFDIDPGNLSFDWCWGYCFGYSYWPYVMVGTDPEDYVMGHTSVSFPGAKTTVSVTCKWNGGAWFSDPIKLYSVNSHSQWFAPWCSPEFGDICDCSDSVDVMFEVTISCGAHALSACDGGNYLSMYTVGRTYNANYGGTICKGDWWTGIWNTSLYGGCQPLCCHISGGGVHNCCRKGWGTFSGHFIDTSCEPVSGTFKYETPYFFDECTGKVTSGSISGG